MKLTMCLSWRFGKVWLRNLVVYRRIWKVNFITPLLEPLFYILSFGLGFSGLIGKVPLFLSYQEFGQRLAIFIRKGLGSFNVSLHNVGFFWPDNGLRLAV